MVCVCVCVQNVIGVYAAYGTPDVIISTMMNNY